MESFNRLSKNNQSAEIKILHRKKHDIWKFGPIHETSAGFTCFAFISSKIVQIPKYFAQSCDCMIAAFKNSEF